MYRKIIRIYRLVEKLPHIEFFRLVIKTLNILQSVALSNPTPKFTIEERASLRIV